MYRTRGSAVADLLSTPIPQPKCRQMDTKIDEISTHADAMATCGRAEPGANINRVCVAVGVGCYYTADSFLRRTLR